MDFDFFDRFESALEERDHTLAAVTALTAMRMREGGQVIQKHQLKAIEQQNRIETARTEIEQQRLEIEHQRLKDETEEREQKKRDSDCVRQVRASLVRLKIELERLKRLFPAEPRSSE